MWLSWVLGGLVVWFLVALVVGVVIGRGIRLADRRAVGMFVVAPPGERGTAAAVGADRGPAQRRRRIPLPTVGVSLAALAVVLEGAGFIDRLTGERSAVLSMDAPLSLPRMYVATLFAAAALAAMSGAGVFPGRRTWWTAVGLVAGLVAAVKAGSTVHADALNALTDAVGPVAALLLSVLLVLAVVATLWFLSRRERRDRARVLGALSFYAVGAVGLSAVSGIVGGLTGASSWTAGATFLEESVEALGGVAFLVAILAGVAPRVVLPAGWPLRRTADAQTLDLPEGMPGRATSRDVIL